MHAGQELLRLDGIGVWLGGREILRDVSFTVRAGEFTGLIGPNGAGKTTLLKVILGLQAPTAGRVLINGRPRPRRSGGRLIGYVPQKLAVDPDMPLRARDVVALGIDGNRLGFPLPSAARRDLVDEALRAVGRRGLRRGPGRGAVRRRAAAGDDRARRDQPAPAAAARRAAGQPRPAQRAGHRLGPGPARPRAADRGADLRPRHEPAAAGDRHRGLRRGGPGRRRPDRRGHPHRGAQRPVREPRRRAARARPGPGGRGRRAGAGAPPGGGRPRRSRPVRSARPRTAGADRWAASCTTSSSPGC